MHQPLVTIAIPTHNRADTYLPEALRCALDQTYPHLEIIVSDNASTDGTADVVARYRDPRVRYVRHGVAMRPNDNFNYCIQQARGRYIALLLDDERIDADFIETCLDALEEAPSAALVRTGLRTIDAHGATVTESLNRANGLPLADFFSPGSTGARRYICATPCLRPRDCAKSAAFNRAIACSKM